VPAETSRYPLSLADNPIEEVECLSNGAISLKFRNQAPIVSRHWVLNLNVHQLARLTAASPEFKKLVSGATEMGAATAQYALRLRVENDGIPCPVRPLSVFFDTDSIPDIDTEIWPIQLFQRSEEKELILWATGPGQASLEMILERFRHGMMRLNHLFPFLSSLVIAQSLPLEMESCASPAARSAALENLETSRIEIYQLTTSQIATRQRGLSAILPFVNCHLPYPLGPLQAAQRLLVELVPKRRKTPPRRTEQIPASPETSPPEASA
jgi:hypothetical protein